ncbi:MAG: YciI family protein [Solirubrobacteraceae bacterium]
MAADDVHHLLLYDYVEDMADRRRPHREAHLERIRAEREAGRITSAGAFDPPTGAAIVFQGVNRGHVEAFVAEDPYVVAGLVTSWRVQRWNRL